MASKTFDLRITGRKATIMIADPKDKNPNAAKRRRVPYVDESPQTQQYINYRDALQRGPALEGLLAANPAAKVEVTLPGDAKPRQMTLKAWIEHCRATPLPPREVRNPEHDSRMSDEALLERLAIDADEDGDGEPDEAPPAVAKPAAAAAAAKPAAPAKPTTSPAPVAQPTPAQQAQAK